MIGLGSGVWRRRCATPQLLVYLTAARRRALSVQLSVEWAPGVRSGSFNISERDDKREQVSTILVNISVN